MERAVTSQPDCPSFPDLLKLAFSVLPLSSGAALVLLTCASPKLSSLPVRASRHVFLKFASNSPMGLCTTRWLRTPVRRSLLRRTLLLILIINSQLGGGSPIPCDLTCFGRSLVAPLFHSSRAHVRTVLRGADSAFFGHEPRLFRSEPYLSPWGIRFSPC